MTLSDDSAEKKFRVALETRNLEIGLLWQRSLFFWGFIAAAFVGYADLLKEKDHDPVQAICVASFGFICSIAWTLANRGSKYWQESWETKLKKSDEKALDTNLFTEPYVPTKTRWWGQWSKEWHFSVSRLVMALSDFTVFVWAVLILQLIPSPHCIQHFNKYAIYLIPLGTLIYAARMLLKTQTSGSDS
jgi:hypothetical protein